MDHHERVRKAGAGAEFSSPASQNIELQMRQAVGQIRHRTLTAAAPDSTSKRWASARVWKRIRGILGRYVREAANVLGLGGRRAQGLDRPRSAERLSNPRPRGSSARARMRDIVVFDPATVIDDAT